MKTARTNLLYSDATPSVTNHYNRLGQLAQQNTANYQLNSMYNLAGQLLSQGFAGGPLNGLSISNQYDNSLRRTSLAILRATTSSQTIYGYDAASPLASVSAGSGDTAAYGYLANSSLAGQITNKQNGTIRVTTTK